jgi:hypothetical protein
MAALMPFERLTGFGAHQALRACAWPFTPCRVRFGDPAAASFFDAAAPPPARGGCAACRPRAATDWRLWRPLFSNAIRNEEIWATGSPPIACRPCAVPDADLASIPGSLGPIVRPCNLHPHAPISGSWHPRLQSLSSTGPVGRSPPIPLLPIAALNCVVVVAPQPAGASMSSSGPYCWLPKMSASPALPLGVRR